MNQSSKDANIDGGKSQMKRAAAILCPHVQSRNALTSLSVGWSSCCWLIPLRERMTYLPGSYEVEVGSMIPLLSRTVTFWSRRWESTDSLPFTADLLSLGINKMRCQSRLWLHLKIVALICVSGFDDALHAGAGWQRLKPTFHRR